MMIDFADVALTERRTPPRWWSEDAPFPAGLAALKAALVMPENAHFKEIISKAAAKLKSKPMPFPWYLYELPLVSFSDHPMCKCLDLGSP